MEAKTKKPGAETVRKARWLRNKRAERSRNRAAQAPPLPEKLIAEIWRERDRRLENYPRYHWNHQNWRYGRGSEEFQCEVWAVKTLLELQTPTKKISDGMISKWLVLHGVTHGYNASSLRTMVWRARQAIEFLETVTGRAGSAPCWPPFECSVPV